MSGVKSAALLLFTPLALFVLNVGLTSVFIESKATRWSRALADNDLVAAVALSQKGTPRASRTHIRDTILRGAVTGEVVPFNISSNSACGTTVGTTMRSDDGPILGGGSSGGKESFSPTIAQIEATSVSYGFPSRDWHEDALRWSLEPRDSETFNGADAFGDALEREEKRFQEFLRKANIDVQVLQELLIQGRTLFSKTLSDSHAYIKYPCTVVDHLEDDIYKARQEENYSVMSTIDQSGFSVYEEESTFVGLRKCRGAAFDWDKAIDLTSTDFHSLRGVLWISIFHNESIIDAVTLKIETFRVSPQVNLTALTIDLPYRVNMVYRDDLDMTMCETNGTLKFDRPEREKKTKLSQKDWEQYEAELCSPRYISYADHDELCNSSSCVFKDESDAMTYKSQALLAPYMKNCDPANLVYNHEINSWFPSGCTPQNNSAILYGAGTFVTGDFFPRRKSISDPSQSTPVLANARRHRVISVAKIDWRFEDVSTRFGATCHTDGGCDGILHPLESANKTNRSSASVLVVGRDDVADLNGYKLERPVMLVMLNSLKHYYGENDPKNKTYYVWDRLDMARLTTNYTVSQGLGLAGDQCSLLIDGYLTQQEANHYYLDEPLQPLYSSALFYLFQNAAVKEVVLPRGSRTGVVDLTKEFIGYARMKGDLVIKEIRYSIPLVSAAATFAGIALMLLYLAVLLQWPRDATKLTHETHFPAQYAQVLSDDRYPGAVHERRLKLPNDDVVEMDDFVVDSITFHHPQDPELKVVL